MFLCLYPTYSPAGWDNDKKISILSENLHTTTEDAYYSDFITKPPTLRKVSCFVSKKFNLSCIAFDN